MVKAVDKRWEGLHLCESIIGLVERFVNVIAPGPCVPAAVALITRGKSPVRQKKTDPFTLPDLLAMTTVTKSFLAKENIRLTDFVGELDKHTSADFKSWINRAAGALGTPEDIAWLKFENVHATVLKWRVDNEAGFSAFVSWVYHLRNDDLTELLKKVSYPSGWLPTVADLKKAEAKAKQRAKTKKFRAKSPKSVTAVTEAGG